MNRNHFDEIIEARQRTELKAKATTRRPILGYLYHGRGYRVNTAGFANYERAETISGTFRIIVRTQEGWVMGNGELPEGVWVIARGDVHKVERSY